MHTVYDTHYRRATAPRWSNSHGATFAPFLPIITNTMSAATILYLRGIMQEHVGSVIVPLGRALPCVSHSLR